jgi:uncharacterized protein (TIGR03067 family)
VNTILFVTALGLGAPALKPKPPAPTLIGEWVAEEITVGGKSDPINQEVRWVFGADGTRTVFHGGERVATGRYTVDAKAHPAAMDLDPDKDCTYPCVFKVEKDRLTVMVNWLGDGRPTGFESRAGTRSTKYVFKRVKPGD